MKMKIQSGRREKALTPHLEVIHHVLVALDESFELIPVNVPIGVFVCRIKETLLK